MKIPIILFIFVMFFGTFFLGNSNALLEPPAPKEDPSLPVVSAQVQIRNAEGVLVAYIEPTNYYLRNLYLIHLFLDEQNTKNIIIDGKSFEQFETEYTHISSSYGQRASYSLWQSGFPVLTAVFNGYMSEPGFITTFSWKIIRTI